MTGIAILAVAVVAALAFGLYRKHSDGRFRRESSVVAPRDRDLEGPQGLIRGEWDAIAAAVPGAELGERATFVQFSSAFCAPCRTTRTLLADISAHETGVTHLEVDAEQHLELVRALDVRRTPTTLVLDAYGAELTRAVGAPRRDQVLAVIPQAVR
ncbi:thioredoxin family protein [Nocardioides ultimimeridianus]